MKFLVSLLFIFLNSSTSFSADAISSTNGLYRAGYGDQVPAKMIWETKPDVMDVHAVYFACLKILEQPFLDDTEKDLKNIIEIEGNKISFSRLQNLKNNAQKLLNYYWPHPDFPRFSSESSSNDEELCEEEQLLIEYAIDFDSVGSNTIDFLVDRFSEGREENRRAIWKR